MRYARTLLVILLVLPFASGGLKASAGEGLALSEQERRAIDERVLNGRDGRAEKPQADFYGSLAGWGVARTPLSAEAERRLAEAEHRQVLQTFETSPAPAEAKRVLKTLVQHLPRAAPDEFEYELTIIEAPELRSWTVGGGYVYLSRAMYDALMMGDPPAEDRLAFVLAHEMGHIVRKHCRVGYQLLKLQEFALRENLEEIEVSQLQKAVNRTVEKTGTKLRFLYEPRQEFAADLFAAHLCRNAGFHVQAGWDVLRQGVLVEEQGGDLLRDPAHALLSHDDSPERKNRPSASERLRQLCIDRDGVISDPQYGLWEFDHEADQWIKPRELKITAKEPVVLLVHGMDSSLSRCYLALARELAGDPDFREHRLLGFQYPGDASLARVGEFLHREISRTCDPETRIDFVCHSAGGLAVRYYAEVKHGSFRRIILQGTPNHGSDWAALRPIVEVKQFVKDLRTGYSQAMTNAILDGQGQMGHDLQPGSLFLNYLNEQQADRSRYTIIRGRRFGRTRTALLGQAMQVGRTLLIRELATEEMPRLVRERAVQSLDRLRLPQEVRQGDLLVSTKSAELDGVADIHTFRLHHAQLSRHRKTISATREILRLNR